MYRTIVALVFLSVALTAQETGTRYDVLIRGGEIIDGTGAARSSGDVAVANGRIAAIGQLDRALARRVIDAKGLVVAPGFIDLHTHSDAPVLADGNAQSQIRQGVTLVLLGEGRSVGPMLTEAARASLESDTITFKMPPPDWESTTEYFDRLRQTGVSPNVATYVGYGQLRSSVLGYETREATPDELEKMKQLALDEMRQGAWGLVSAFQGGGYEYPKEVLGIAKVVKEEGGNFYSHIGSEGYQLVEEVQKAIRVAEETGIGVHIFHLKIRGKRLWDKLDEPLGLIEKARAKGLKITANQYPYTAMQHPVGNVFPSWIKKGKPEDLVARLKDPATVEKLKRDEQFISYVAEHGGWDNIIASVIRSEKNKKYEGKSIAQIAKERGIADPTDACIQLHIEENGWIHGVHFNMSEDNVRRIMKLPYVAIASDGRALATEGNLAVGKPHPRSFGTNPRVLGKYVREDRVLTLEDAVRKMSGLPAEILGLRDRGVIKVGNAADLVVFDPAAVADQATFQVPFQYPAGIPHVLVNGVVVIDGGAHTGARPGTIVLGPGYKPRSPMRSADARPAVEKPRIEKTYVDLVAQDKGRSRGVLFTPAGQRPATVVVNFHPNGDRAQHFTMSLLPEAGVAAFGMASRFFSRSGDTIQEDLALDIAAAIRYMRNEGGFRHVVLLGHSGGGAPSAFYVSQAESAPADRISSTPAGDGPNLTKMDLPNPDAYIIMSPTGPLTQKLDPSVVDETDIASVDPLLDMYNPANGFKEAPHSSSYTEEFLTRYREAQRARMQRLDDQARQYLRQQKEYEVWTNTAEFAQLPLQVRLAIKRRAIDNKYIIIHRTSADPRFTDLSIEPSDREYGLSFSQAPHYDNPEIQNYHANSTEVMSLAAFLSTGSAISSNNRYEKTLPKITLPALFIQGTADKSVFMGAAAAMFEMLGSVNKRFVKIEGAEHIYLPAGPKKGKGDQKERAAAAIVSWINELFGSAPPASIR